MSEELNETVEREERTYDRMHGILEEHNGLSEEEVAANKRMIAACLRRLQGSDIVGSMVDFVWAYGELLDHVGPEMAVLVALDYAETR